MARRIEQAPDRLDESFDFDDDGRSASPDPLSLFLKEANKIPLLKPEEEIALAKIIEAGEAASKRLGRICPKAASCPVVTSSKVSPDNPSQLCIRPPVQSPPVNPQECHKLAEAARAVDPAKKRFTEANCRLVIPIAKKYADRGVLFPDLIQEGNIGLMRAVDKYDWRRGYKFSTYATWWISQAVSRAVANQGRTIRLPVHIVEKIHKFNACTISLVQELGREPTTEEIAKALGVDENRVGELQKISQIPISLETPAGEKGDGTLKDFIADPASSPEEQAADSLLQEAVAKALKSLSARERRVLELRFGLADGRERTLEEVGEQFKITRERARQIEGAALKGLKLAGNASKLRSLLP